MVTTKKKSSGFSFRGKVASDAEKQKRAGSSYGHLLLPRGTSVFNAEPGSRVLLDFIPYIVTDEKHPDRDDDKGNALPGDPWYKRPYSLHRNVGAGNDSAVCLASIGKKCPICEYRAKRMKEGAEKEETDTIKPSRRNLYVVIPLDSKKNEAVPHIFDISQFLFQELLNKELKEDENMEVFPALDEGLSLKVRFDSNTVGTSKPFAEASRIDFIERDTQYEESLLEEVPNLDEVLIILTYKQLENKFLEMENEQDGGKLETDDDDNSKKPPLRSKKTLTKAPAAKEPTYTWEELEGMSVRRLAKLADEERLQVLPESYEDDEDGLRSAIAEELGVEIPADEPPEQETTKPKRGPITRNIPVATGGKDKCPHKHKFGTDFEKFDECPDCKLWDDCYDVNKKK
jgi:hypothetical protein